MAPWPFDTPERRAAAHTTMTEVVLPTDTNHYGTIFGGRLLDLMDRVAWLTASRFCHLNFVTASVDRITFDAPIKEGHIIELVGDVTEVRVHSLAVRVMATGEDPLSGRRWHCSGGTFYMVCVDRTGRPISLHQGPVVQDNG